MHAISATDSRLKLTTLLSKAQREPVVIRDNHRDIAVMLSATEYHRLNKGAAGTRLMTPAGRRRMTPPAARRMTIDPKLAALLDGSD